MTSDRVRRAPPEHLDALYIRVEQLGKTCPKPTAEAAVWLVRPEIAKGPGVPFVKILCVRNLCNPYLLQAMDSSICVIGMMDGSTRSVSTSVDTVVWVRLIWPKDGFPVNGDW